MTIPFPPPEATEAERLMAERDRLYAEREAVQAKLTPVLNRLAELGVEDHAHGEYTFAEPGWWHAHPFDDPDHEHHGSAEETEARERAWDGMP